MLNFVLSRAAMVLAIATASLVGALPAGAAERELSVVSKPSRGSLALAEHGVAAPILVAQSETPAVARVVRDLSADIASVTGVQPQVLEQPGRIGSTAIIIGTLGSGGLIDTLARSGRLKVATIAGRWEEVDKFDCKTQTDPARSRYLWIERRSWCRQANPHEWKASNANHRGLQA